MWLVWLFALSSFGLEVPKNFHLTFLQKYKTFSSKEWEKTEGELFYSYPGKIKVEVHSPVSEKSTLISNTDKTWVYHPPFLEGEAGELTLFNSDYFLLKKVLDALVKRKKSDSFKIKKLKNTIIVSLDKKMVNESGVTEVRILSSNKLRNLLTIKKIEVRYRNGKNVHYIAKNFKKLKHISNKKFSYYLPKNTQITDHRKK